MAGGALGLLIALWRDRTFQSISLTILMVVFSVAGVEAFALAYPTLEFMGVPLVEVLNPYRAMLAVLYPRSDQLTGVVRASSLVYITVRMTFAAALVAFGTYKLRKWNPGYNEPREDREDAEVEAIESLIEVDEEPAMASVGVGSSVATAVGHSKNGVSDRSRTISATSSATGSNGLGWPRRRAGANDGAPRSPADPPTDRAPGQALSPTLAQPDPLAQSS